MLIQISNRVYSAPGSGTIRPVEIAIERMTLADLDEVLIIENYSFPTPWDRRSYEQDIKYSPVSRFYTARGNAGEIAGYIGNWFFADECHIGTLAVAREWRRLGIAKALIAHSAAQAVTESLKYAILEVRVGNRAAIALYEALGFRIIGQRAGYYQDTGEDAHMMMHSDLAALAGIPVGSE